MASPAPTTTRPTEGQPASPARAGVEVFAITTRDDFLLELGEAFGGQAAVRPVESAAEALEYFGRSKQVQMLVVDSRDVADVRAEIDRVETQAPHVVSLVFAPAESEQEVAAALKGSLVFAVLPVPVDVRKTAAVFDGALATVRNKQSTPAPRATPSRPLPLIEESAAPGMSPPLRPEPREPAPTSRNARLVIGVLLAAIVAGALWYFTRGANPKSATVSKGAAVTTAPAQGTAAPAAKPEAAPVVETSLVSGKVDDLLEKARLAMRERRYTEPAGNNALLYYRSAMAADATNGEALDGLGRLATVLSARFDEAMSGAHLDEAALTLAQFKSAVPVDSRIAAMESRIATARKELAKAQEEARQKRLAEEQTAREALAAEQRKAREAKAAAEAERQVQLAREKEQQEKLKQEQAAQTALATKAAPTKAAASRSPGALQNSLKRKRYVAPEYPQDALAKHIGGVVTIGFTVNLKGEPRDVRVVSAEPAKVFDRAAMDAVKRWRYEPLVIDGTPTEVPVRMAIRFAPPD